MRVLLSFQNPAHAVRVGGGVGPPVLTDQTLAASCHSRASKAMSVEAMVIPMQWLFYAMIFRMKRRGLG